MYRDGRPTECAIRDPDVQERHEHGDSQFVTGCTDFTHVRPLHVRVCSRTIYNVVRDWQNGAALDRCVCVLCYIHTWGTGAE